MAKDVTRARGRPRSAAVDQAILSATSTLVDRVGYHALTVEGVAALAGVAKTTIYRRYPSKPLLVLASLSEAAEAQPQPLPDTGTLREDLIAMARLVREEVAPGSPSAVGAALIGEASRDPAVAERLRAFADQRFAQVQPLYARAVRRREVHAQVDWRVVAELLGGWIFHASVISRRTPDDTTIAHVVDLVLAGLEPRPA
jgi:AcrR family transcriptional regulator